MFPIGYANLIVVVMKGGPKKKDLVEDKMNTEYYFRGGLRYVKDYYHVYKTFCKQRWLNTSLLQSFVKEFKAFDEPYYVNFPCLKLHYLGCFCRGKPLPKVGSW